LVVLALMAPGNVSSDGTSMLAVTTSLTTHGSFAVPCQVGVPGQGGQCFSTYYPLQSLLAVPFMAIGRAAATAVDAPAEYVGEFAAQIVPTLAAAGVATFTAYFACEFQATRARALMAGLTVAFATEIAVYYRTFFADVLATLMACLVVFGFLRHRRWLAGVGIVLLILAKPQLVPIGLLIGLVFAHGQRDRRPAIDAVVATIVGAVAYASYNILRFGNPTNFGGEARAIKGTALAPGKLIDALGLLTISPGRGFLWYSPIVLAGIFVLVRRRDLLARTALAVFVGALLLHLANPGTGNNWGSRYLIAAIPLLAAAAWSLRGWAPWALAAVGLVLVAPTFAGFYHRYYVEQAERGATSNHHVYWSVVDSPAVGVWGSSRRTIEVARRTDVNAVARAADATPTGRPRVSDQRFFTVVAQWWWMTPAAHIPRVLGFLGALVMLGAGGLLLRLALDAGAPDPLH
jgi:hypothetical protein